MSIVSKSAKTLLLSLFLLTTTSVQMIRAETETPHFGEGMLILQVSDQYRGFPETTNGNDLYNSANQFKDIELSLSGEIVVARTRVQDVRGDFPMSNLYVWDTRQLEISNTPISPTPFAARSMDNEEAGAAFAVSPNERFLVMRTAHELQLITFPELAFSQVVSIDGPILSGSLLSRGTVAWSDDSRLFGTIVGRASEILVWDIVSNRTYTHASGATFTDWYWYLPNLAFMNGGWLIYNFYEQPPLMFVFCDRYLEECRSYDLSDLPNDAQSPYSVASKSGVLITYESNHRTIIRSWLYQGDGQYILTPEPLVFEGIIALREFSSSGEYLYTEQWLNERTGTIWDFDTLAPLHQLEEWRTPCWLPGEEYFVTFGESPWYPGWTDYQLRLYRLGQPEPIDVLDLSTVEGVDPNELAFNELTRIEGLSEDGHTLLVNVGGVAFVVPIEYE